MHAPSIPSRVRPRLACLVPLLALAACGRDAELKPPQVHWGEDVCAHCTMIVSEERHAAAAAVRTEAGDVETRVYDDISCLLAETGVQGFAARWVHDFDEVRWIVADSAYFVPSRTLRTPMGSGLAAFASEERARAFAAQEDAEATDWPSLLKTRGRG